MSSDSPTHQATETDKPAPAAPVPADHGSTRPRPPAEPRSQAQHAADVHSRPPIRRFEPPAGSSTPPGTSHSTETRTPPGSSERPHGQSPPGQNAGTADHRSGTPATPQSTARPLPETGGSHGGPAARAPGSGTATIRDQDGRPAPETARPRDEGGRGPGREPPGSGRQPAEPRSQAQFAKEVMSRPPICRFEPATPPLSQDTSGSPASQATEPASATRQRPSRETAQQDDTSARTRESGGREPSEARSPEAILIQAGTAEHEPQTQDPGPSPEAATPPGENGAVGQHAQAEHPILHITSEFHGQKLGLYTDGTHWKSEEAVRAMAAEDRKDRQSGEAAEPGISGAPTQRDLGDSTRGENPDVHLGDTTDTRTFAEKMRGEAPFGQDLGARDEPSESRLGRAFDSAFEEGDNTHDGWGSVGEAISDILPRGMGPTGTHVLPSGHAGYEAVPSQGLNMTDAIGGTVLLMVATVTGIRHMANRNRRDD